MPVHFGIQKNLSASECTILSCRFVEYAMKMAEDDRDLVIQDFLDKESKFSKAAGGIAWGSQLDFHLFLSRGGA